MTIDQVLLQVKDQWGIETVQAIKLKLSTSGFQGAPLSYSGNLISSIKYTPTGQLDGDNPFSMASYGQYVDEGTGLKGPKKQAIPQEKVPGIAFYIKPWADSKGLNNFAVAQSIVNNGGLQPRKFFNTVIESRIENLKEAFDQAYKNYLDQVINSQQK